MAITEETDEGREKEGVGGGGGMASGIHSAETMKPLGATVGGIC